MLSRNGKKQIFCYFYCMNPSEKDWINNYLELFSSSKKAQDLHKPRKLDHDRSLYKIIQPTGLMYGHPIQPSAHYDLAYSKWSEHDKMKFILLDSLMNNAILTKGNQIRNQKEMDKTVEESVSLLANYYQEAPATKPSLFSIKIKHESDAEYLDAVLKRRITLQSSWRGNFWAEYFQNSLLFLDVYFFGQWLQSKKSVDQEVNFSNQQENLRLNILQIMAAAAHADHKIQKEEKALFNFFLQSANLGKANRKIAHDFLKSDLKLKDVPFEKNDSWIIRKYILELAILTVWADRLVEETEKEFVQKLANHLGFPDDELESSLLAIESFVISNWKQVHFLQKKHDLLIVKDRFMQRISRVVVKNKNAFMQEIKESEELMMLLHKMIKENLTEEEKSKVQKQLIDILKSLPTFVIIALPGTFITLPVLLKLLPKSAFPSAFSEID